MAFWTAARRRFLLFFLSLSAAAWFSEAAPRVLVKDGRSAGYLLVSGRAPLDQFAAREFTDIFRRSTGITLKTVFPGGDAAELPRKRIFIGDTPQTRRYLKEAAIPELPPDASLIAGVGEDIVIAGGGAKGACYGVYAFLEKTLGYRFFTPEDECVPVCKDVVYSGELWRETPAFPMGRKLYMLYLRTSGGPLFQFRNRGMILEDALGGGFTEQYPCFDSGHGFHLYITTEKTKDYYPWDTPRDYFASHPDYFSLDANGKRTPRLQLCFSNPELREEVLKRLIERGRRIGGRGVLVFGANDWPGSFCQCAACRDAEQRRASPAGAFYECLLDILPKLHRELPDIRVSALAYRKRQTEAPPRGIARMPENFICDFAPVDDDQGQFLDAPANRGTLENLQRWAAMTDQITYWYYACVTTAPYGIINRIAHDLRVMRDAGVRGAGICGDATPGLFPLQEYLFLRQAACPDQDPWVPVRDYTAFMYGGAASDFNRYLEEVEAVWAENKVRCELYGPGSVLLDFTPDRLIRWQALFDAMTPLAADDPRTARNLARARIDVDSLCLDHYLRIKTEHPEWPVTPEALITRFRQAPMPEWYRNNYAARVEAAYLMAKAAGKPIPPPLDRLPAARVRAIPLCGDHDAEDPDAVAGRAKWQYLAATNDITEHPFCFYDQAERRTLSAGKIMVDRERAGSYMLYRVGESTIKRTSLLAFGDWWIGFNLAPYYPEGDEHHVYEFWASLKFTGPAFDAQSGQTRNRAFCDRIFIVDRSGLNQGEK